MSDKSLETLKVVVEASSKPLQDEMRKIRKEMNDATKDIREYQEKMKKSMDEQLAPVRKVREQINKMMEGIRKAYNIPTPANKMKDMQKEIDNTEKKLEKLIAARNELEASGGDIEYTQGYKEIAKAVESAERRLDSLKKKQELLKLDGKDEEISKEYKELTKWVDVSRSKLNALEARQEKMKASGTYNKKSWKSLQYDIDQARKQLAYAVGELKDFDTKNKTQKTQSWKHLQNVIAMVEKELKDAKAVQTAFTDAEKYQDTSKYTKICNDIKKTRSELAQLNAQQQDYEEAATHTRKVTGVFKGLQRVLKGVSSTIKKTGGIFAALIQKFKTGIPLFHRANSSMNRMGRTGRELGGIFKTVGMTARFMFASFLLKGVVDQAKEGLQNLAQYSNAYGTQFNKSATAMHSSLLQLKNALATAFEPIVNAVAPYITKFIGYMVSGANAVAQFLSALTGSKTWTKATYNAENYAESLDNAADSAKKLNRELYSFDEINKQSDDSSSSKSSNKVQPGNMFTTETVNNQFSNFAKQVKDAWSKADFTGIGKKVGEKLKKELDKINWKSIQSKFNKGAKCVATFVNGFISVKGLDKSIGKTIGNMVNTGVSTANTFFKTTNFTKLGTFIASVANNAIRTTDFGLLGETVANGLKAGIDTWYGFVTTFDFTGLGEKISQSINSFFARMNHKEYDGKSGQLLSGWQKLGISLGKSASGLADTIVTAFKKIDWKEVRKGVSDLIGSMLNNLNVNVAKVILTLGVFTVGKIALEGAKAAIVAKVAALLGGGAASTAGTATAAGGGVLSTIASVGIPLTLILSADVFTIKNGRSILESVSKTMIPFQAQILGKIFGFSDSEVKKASDGAVKDFKKSLDKFHPVKDFIDSVKSLFTGGGGLNKEHVNSAKKWLKIDVDVKTNNKKAASGLYAGVSKELAKIGPLKTGIKSTITGQQFQHDLQYGTTGDAGFGSQDFFTWAKVKNSGISLQKGMQNGTDGRDGFNKLLFHTKAKSDTSGLSIFNTVQKGSETSKGFGSSVLHTKAKSDTSGNSIRKVVQDQFGLKSLHTKAEVTTSGNSLRAGLQPGFGAHNLTTGVTLPNGGTAFDQFNNEWAQKAPTLFADVKIGVGKSLNGVNSITQPAKDILINYIPKKNGGVFAGGSWHPIAKYASGGTPQSAQIFMAREAGAELVGTIGNHTAVMNNDQIVASVSAGVRQAVISAMMEVYMATSAQQSDSKQPVEVAMYVDGKELARVSYKNYEELVRSGKIKPAFT